MIETGPDLVEALAEPLAEPGFVHLRAPRLPDMLGWTGEDWSLFAASWDRLGPDLYMADGGRYRRRRHAAFAVRDGAAQRKQHQPHFQSRDYNRLNGDVQRWFDPIEPEIGESVVLRAVFGAFTPLFGRLDGGSGAGWHCEVHQFRIETSAAELGRPTPEGLHRDGVDWVLVALIDRHNVAEGTTEIGDLAGRPLGRFTLRMAGDAVVLDDRKIRHGVTPIRALSEADPAWRDVLVVTWQGDGQGDAPDL